MFLGVTTLSDICNAEAMKLIDNVGKVHNADFLHVCGHDRRHHPLELGPCGVNTSLAATWIYSQLERNRTIFD